MMRMPSTKTVLFASLVAVAALPLTACVAPGYYGAQPGYPQQQQYATPGYAQPAYSQPGYVQLQPAYPNQAPQPYDQYGNQSQYGTQPYDQYGNQQQQQQYATPYGAQYGTVSNIQPVNGSVGPSGVAGTVVGALVGGLVGNQFGRGHGRDAATVIGALGGAVAGNQIGQQMGAAQGPSSYRIDVQVSDGSMRSFDVQSPGNLRPGDRVQINGNQLSRY
ncbi:MAG: glycine zipper 2TM domain-containing protein [Burkholderia sp.]|nr:glycine zipper 2TM domain-containing protein [Burkholderia sp.]